MTVENANYIDGLDALEPPLSGVISQADDHLRLTKRVLANTFAGTGSGLIAPIITTETETNFLVGLTANIQTQLDEIKNGQVPIGGIMPYTGTFASIPSNYALCDGGAGTPNLTDRFVYGATDNIDNGLTGGSSTATMPSHNHAWTHTHTGSTGSGGSHRHLWTLAHNAGMTGGWYEPRSSASSTVANMETASVPDHTHTSSTFSGNMNTPSIGISPAGRNTPPYIKMAFIMRIS